MACICAYRCIATALIISAVNSQKLEAVDKNIWVNEHNKLRAQEDSSNMQKMVWDDDVAKLAEETAKKCVFEHRTPKAGTSSHRFEFYFADGKSREKWTTYVRHSVTTENLYVTSSDKAPSTKQVMTSWYNENKWYDRDANKCNAPLNTSCGHFTQIIWAKTCAVGCAVAKCSKVSAAPGIKDGYLVVCQYGPAGNANQQNPYEKGETCSKCTSSKCDKPAGLCEPTCAEEEEKTKTTTSTGGGQPGSTDDETEKETKQDACSNAHELCKFWASKGECEKNPSFMGSRCSGACSRSCADGGRLSPTPTDCSRNYHPNCDFWAKLGQCQANAKYMRWQCPKACDRRCAGASKQQKQQQGAATAAQTHKQQQAFRPIARLTAADHKAEFGFSLRKLGDISDDS